MGSPSYRLPWQGLLGSEILAIPVAATTSILPECCHTVQMYIECLPSVISVMWVLCVLIHAAATAGIARSSQLSSSLAGQAVQYVKAKAGSTACLSQYKSSPLRPSPPARQGRTPCWVKALRPSFPVSLQSQMVGRVTSLAEPCRSTFLGSNGTRFVRCHFRAQKVSIFRDHAFKWPGNGCCTHHNHYVPRHMNNRYININMLLL
jgi:hypothetical protein